MKSAFWLSSVKIKIYRSWHVDVTKSEKGRRRHIFIVSDATASTCEIVVKAALSQFKETSINLHKVRYTTTEHDVVKVINEARAVDGIVAYTLVSKELRKKIEHEGRDAAVPTIDVFWSNTYPFNRLFGNLSHGCTRLV